MKLPSIISLTAALVLAAAPLAAAQTQNPPPPRPEQKPAQKTEAPTTATFVGKWTVNVDSPQGAMQSALELKLDEKDTKKLRGTLNSQLGEAPVEGEFTDGKLVFWINMSTANGELSLTFSGEPQKDGSVAGTLDFGGGAIAWTAVRVKG
jgi:hypothetical protein